MNPAGQFNTERMGDRKKKSTLQEEGKLRAGTAGSDQPRLPRHSAAGILAVLHVNITTSLYVDNSISPMSSLVSRHTIRQLECVFPGALATYYYGTISEFLQILSGNPHGNPVQGGWLAR